MIKRLPFMSSRLVSPRPPPPPRIAALETDPLPIYQSRIDPRAALPLRPKNRLAFPPLGEEAARLKSRLDGPTARRWWATRFSLAIKHKLHLRWIGGSLSPAARGSGLDAIWGWGWGGRVDTGDKHQGSIPFGPFVFSAAPAPPHWREMGSCGRPSRGRQKRPQTLLQYKGAEHSSPKA